MKTSSGIDLDHLQAVAEAAIKVLGDVGAYGSDDEWDILTDAIRDALPEDVAAEVLGE